MGDAEEGEVRAEPIDVESLDIGAVIPGNAPVTSLDFHHAGEHLVIAASKDGSVQLVNALEGKARKKVFCRKYGVEFVKFTHHEQAFLHTSRPASSTAGASSLGDAAHDIRLLSLYDNEYLRFFSGHTGRVTSLSMSYDDDRFLSGSVDGTVKLWTLQEPKCIGEGVLHETGGVAPTLVDFDSTGLIMAAGGYVKDRHVLKLYDARSFTEGSFAQLAWRDEEITERLMEKGGLDSAKAKQLARATWTGVSFSADGKLLLVTTSSAVQIILDSFDMSIKQIITGYSNAGGHEVGGSITPDGSYVVTGSEDHDVHVFAADTGKLKRKLKGHTGPVMQVVCNPAYELVASACSQTVLWIPKQVENSG